MSARRAGRVAWSLSGIGFALVAAALALMWLGSRPAGADSENFFQGVATTVAFALVGGLVARLAAFAWFPAFGLVPLALLLFPDGRLPGQRWRAAAWAAGAGLVVCTVCLAVSFLGDPAASVTAEGANPTPPPAILVGAALGLAALVAGALAAVASLLLRWRRARGDERQQLKCLLLAAAAFLGSTLVAVVAANWLEVPGGWLFGLVGAVAVPVGAAVAILGYRLYEIDRLINRTLVYGLVSALLAAVYAAGGVRAGRPAQPGRRPVRVGRGRLHPGRGGPVRPGPPADPGPGRLVGRAAGVVDRTVQPAGMSL